MSLSQQQYNGVRQTFASVSIDVSSQVLEVVRRSYRLGLDLRWEHLHFNVNSLHKVAHLIENGAILTLHTANPSQVLSQFRLATDEALYLHTADVLLVGSRHLHAPYPRSMILHELVHARLDMKGKPARDLTSEELALIYQFMYLRKANFQPPNNDRLGAALFKVADSFLAGSRPSSADVSSLHNLVRSHPTYARQFQLSRNVRAYDGIRH
jgi:hypothetical protein